jgi:hypothetical protein
MIIIDSNIKKRNFILDHEIDLLWYIDNNSNRNNISSIAANVAKYRFKMYRSIIVNI